MKVRLPLILSLLIAAAMAGLSAWAWPQVPEAARVAVHFGTDGVANGFAGKQQALLMLPAMSLGLIALLSVIPYIEPRRLNLAASMKFYSAVWIGAIALLAVAHAAIVLTAVHIAVNVEHLILPAVAVLFMVIGNYLGKTRSNFFAGVRTPWTLSSDYSWEKTHRLTGRLFVLASMVALVASFVLDAGLAGMILVASVLASALVGVIASYFYWRRDPLRHSSDGAPE
jgi:uncharacterized membrane protein